MGGVSFAHPRLRRLWWCDVCSPQIATVATFATFVGVTSLHNSVCKNFIRYATLLLVQGTVMLYATCPLLQQRTVTTGMNKISKQSPFSVYIKNCQISFLHKGSSHHLYYTESWICCNVKFVSSNELKNTFNDGNSAAFRSHHKPWTMITKSFDIFPAGFRASHVNLPASSTSTVIISNSSPSNDILQNIQ